MSSCGGESRPCAWCDDPRMAEYGRTVGETAGRAGGSQGGGGSGGGDWGSQIGQFVSDTVHNISTLPAEQLVLLVVAIIVGLVILKRAF